jgi:hypothetical protein
MVDDPAAIRARRGLVAEDAWKRRDHHAIQLQDAEGNDAETVDDLRFQPSHRQYLIERFR